MIAEAKKQRPATVHFPLMAGRHNIDAVGIPLIEDRLASTATIYVNTHLAPHAKDFDMVFDTRNERYLEPLVEAMETDIARMVEHFGSEKIILENANYDPNYQMPVLVIYPEVITRVVEETKCGLLLDLAHARMSAVYLGIDMKEYINRLPLYALRELHVAGEDAMSKNKSVWSIIIR